MGLYTEKPAAFKRISRSCGVWSEFSDGDLQYRIKSFQALIRSSEYEIESIERELKGRTEFDANISRL